MDNSVINRKRWGIGISLLFIIALLMFLFVKHYHMLSQTIEKERSTYISEIRNQLVKNINAEKEEQITLVNLYAQILSKFEPHYFDEINNLLSYNRANETGDEIFLADTKGNVYTLDGSQKRLLSRELIYDLTVEKREVFGYSQINEQKEFWIYGAPIKELIVEESEICAVINARAVENFSGRMSTEIMSNSGYSYIMSKSGNVLVFPQADNPMGYNFFHTLEGYHVDSGSISKMKNDFQAGIESAQILSFNNNKWLLNYSGDLFDDWVVVVMMPMTITGASTYKMLNQTTVLLTLLFVGITCFLLLIIRVFYLRERARERLIQEEKANLLVAQKIAESKNSFLAKMSHDIRTPLNAIIGLLQITADVVSDKPPKASENLNQAEKAAEYLLNVLNDILDMSKIESGKMEIRKAPFDIKELMETLRTINSSQIAAKQIDFQVRTEGILSDCYMGDKVRISQVMMNLLSNAIKFTGQSGHIQFTLKGESVSNHTDKLTFIVQDDGIGMTKDYMKRLFEPFEQAKETQNLNAAGSGLGLSIVKNLVELMEGSIEAESKNGYGSRFTVTLNLERTIKPEIVAEETFEDISLEGKNVLLVEDNELNAMIAEEILMMYHISVTKARNGLEAAELFEESHDGEYDLILMDIRMPIMNGLEAARKIRSLPHPSAATIPIVAMSANAFNEDIAAAYESGMNGYLSKPVDIKKLITTLKKCCGKSRDKDEK